MTMDHHWLTFRLMTMDLVHMVLVHLLATMGWKLCLIAMMACLDIASLMMMTMMMMVVPSQSRCLILTILILTMNASLKSAATGAVSSMWAFIWQLPRPKQTLESKTQPMASICLCL